MRKEVQETCIIIPDKELTTQQRVARKRFAQKYANPEKQYGHLQKILANIEEAIRNHKIKDQASIDFFRQEERETVKLMKELGLKPQIDVMGYDDDDNNPNRDWRE